MWARAICNLIGHHYRTPEPFARKQCTRCGVIWWKR